MVGIINVLLERILFYGQDAMKNGNAPPLVKGIFYVLCMAFAYMVTLFLGEMSKNIEVLSKSVIELNDKMATIAQKTFIFEQQIDRHTKEIDHLYDQIDKPNNSTRRPR